MHVTQHQAPRAGGTEAVSRELRYRIEVVDALYRFGLGQDLRDRELFASAGGPDRQAVPSSGIMASGRINAVRAVVRGLGGSSAQVAVP